MYKALLKRIAGGLVARNIPYMVIGGQAVLVYGAARSTNDVDVTLGVGPEGFQSVLEWVRHEKLEVLHSAPEAFMAETMVLPCRDPLTGVRVDLIFSYDAFERAFIKRAESVRIDDTEIKFARAEDLVILKVIAGRPRDIEDVRGILLKNPQVDLAFVRGLLRQVAPDSGPDYEARLNEALPRNRGL